MSDESRSQRLGSFPLGAGVPGLGPTGVRARTDDVLCGRVLARLDARGIHWQPGGMGLAKPTQVPWGNDHGVTGCWTTRRLGAGRMDCPRLDCSRRRDVGWRTVRRDVRGRGRRSCRDSSGHERCDGH